MEGPVWTKLCNIFKNNVNVNNLCSGDTTLSERRDFIDLKRLLTRITDFLKTVWYNIVECINNFPAVQQYAMIMEIDSVINIVTMFCIHRLCNFMCIQSADKEVVRQQRLQCLQDLTPLAAALKWDAWDESGSMKALKVVRTK